MIALTRILAPALAGAALTLSFAAHAGVTADDLLSGVDAKQRETLLAGDILVFARPEQETDDAGLAVTLGVIVPADLKKTLDTLRAINASGDPNENVTTREIVGPVKGDGSSKVFADVAFLPSEGEEVKKLLQAQPGDTFNFSKEEFGWVRQAAAAGGDPAKAAARVMRRVLASRYLAYHQSGLDGLAPYARGGKDVSHPGAELAATTEAMPIGRKHLPEFYNAYRHYPKDVPDGLQSNFYWEKKTIDGRPMFSVRHELVEIRPDYAVIGIRDFYIDNNLDAFQVAIVFVPYGSQTLVALANQTYTENVSGAKRIFAVHVGRSIVESNTKPLFEKLQKALGRAKPMTGTTTR
jgi:hypothetical protein